MSELAILLTIVGGVSIGFGAIVGILLALFTIYTYFFNFGGLSLKEKIKLKALKANGDITQAQLEISFYRVLLRAFHSKRKRDKINKEIAIFLGPGNNL